MNVSTGSSWRSATQAVIIPSFGLFHVVWDFLAAEVPEEHGIRHLHLAGQASAINHPWTQTHPEAPSSRSGMPRFPGLPR